MTRTLAAIAILVVAIYAASDYLIDNAYQAVAAMAAAFLGAA